MTLLSRSNFGQMICTLCLPLAAVAGQPTKHATVLVSADGQKASLHVGMLDRDITLQDGVPYTASLRVDKKDFLDTPGEELRFSVRVASPNRRPTGLRPGEGGTIDVVGKQLTTDVLDVQELGVRGVDSVAWVDPIELNSRSWTPVLGSAKLTRVAHAGGDQLLLQTKPKSLGLTVAIHYATYLGQPAIRKWVEIKNEGTKWLKVDGMSMEAWKLGATVGAGIPLTPSERGAQASLIARGIEQGRYGVILGSEVPSALRSMGDDGSMGYANDRFEWVIGPGESFISEPVFEYAYAGPIEKTVSATSTPLDRTVEGNFQKFLHDDVGLITSAKNIQAPQFSNWSTFGPNIDDALIRKLADIAAASGFKMFELEEGWQKDNLGTEPNVATFPDFLATTQYIRATGMRLGMWVASYRTTGAKDFAALPDAASRPAIKRMGGLGMSFASTYKHYYAQDLADLSKKYGATYFKEDFSDVRFGDAAEGHESRTRKESLLRGLRGLLEAQDELRHLAPSVSPELTHEIYWGTPGVPCDLAALKHVQSYHIPPNDYSGTLQGRSKADRGKTTYNDLHESLISGAFNARQRLYAHRGLPMYAIEYYGAATFNAGGSLTSGIQDRQVTSWLMGAPAVYSGDLRTLTPENVKQYRNRFDMLARLQKQYGIYGYFEFSGVPEPTDIGWHWWGKLNERGYGAVVVLRGSAGGPARAVNIPWVKRNTRYKVRALLSDQPMGVFSGAALQSGDLSLQLDPYGQEILELAPEMDGK